MIRRNNQDITFAGEHIKGFQEAVQPLPSKGVGKSLTGLFYPGHPMGIIKTWKKSNGNP
jgi:hypothetical protein